jgi:hypothetical protein
MSLITSRASFDTIDVPEDDSDGRGFSVLCTVLAKSNYTMMTIIISFYKVMVLVCRPPSVMKSR